MNKKHLNGSKWTSLQAENKRRHFICLQHNQKEKSVLMQAIIDKSQFIMNEKVLNEQSAWISGWSK